MTNKQLLINELLQIKKIDEWKNYQFCIEVKENDKTNKGYYMGTYVYSFFKDGKNLIETRFFQPNKTIKFLLKNIDLKNYFIKKI